MDTTQTIENSTDQKVQEPAVKAPLASEGAASSENKGTPPEKTYTQTELDALIKMAQTKAGRDLAPVIKERDSLKAKLAENDSSIADKQAELEELQAQVDELAAGSPEHADLLKDKKELKAELKKLTDDRVKLDAEKLEHAETLKVMQSDNRSLEIFKTLHKYQVSEEKWDSMYDLCDRFGADKAEDFEAIAKTIGGKEPEKKPDETKNVHVDSGRGSGGGLDYDNMSPKEKIEYGLKHPKK